ncbi:unnamed protein product [Gordionus sp. m RMFG-2023]
MEFKSESTNSKKLDAKSTEKRWEDSGISHHTSHYSSSNLSVKSDSLIAVVTNDNKNKDLICNKNMNQQSLTIPICISRFVIYPIGDNVTNSASITIKKLNAPIRYEIRNLYINEIVELYNWSVEEFGYRAHCDYVKSLYNCYPSGWTVAVNEKGKIIGTISGVNMNDDQAFGILFAVKKCYRCHGIGAHLWKVGLNHFGNRNLGVNAVESEIAPNEKLGMKLAFRMSRYSGKLTLRVMNSLKLKFIFQAPISNNFIFTKLSNIQESSQASKWNQKVLLHSLVEYDAQINKISRAQFLEEAVNHFENTVTIICTEETIIANDEDQNDMIEQLPKVVGYGMLRPRIEGCSIGPLYADSPVLAESIFRHLINYVTEPNTLIDITIIDDSFDKNYAFKTPTGNLISNLHMRRVKNLILSLRLKLECHLYRMYSKYNVDLLTNKVFAMNSSIAFLS